MAHIHEKIDFTASVYIVRDNKVLLHVHKSLNIWLPPGGHIELDEDPNEAAIREAKEETGLDITLMGEGKTYASAFKARDLIAPRFLNRHFITDDHEHVDMIYFARAPYGEPKAETGGGEMRWFTEEEIEENTVGIVEDVGAHALTALKELRT